MSGSDSPAPAPADPAGPAGPFTSGSSSRHPIPTVLVTGPSAAAREAAIGKALQYPATPRSDGAAVILEGLPDGNVMLEASDHLLISRIAPGCLCCAGNLVMRVTLNRLLRQRPARLFIGIADTTHLDQLRSWLSSAPYDQLLAFMPDLCS